MKRTLTTSWPPSEAVIQGNFYDLSVTLDGRVKPGHGVVRSTSGKREVANS